MTLPAAEAKMISSACDNRSTDATFSFLRIAFIATLGSAVLSAGAGAAYFLFWSRLR